LRSVTAGDLDLCGVVHGLEYHTKDMKS